MVLNLYQDIGNYLCVCVFVHVYVCVYICECMYVCVIHCYVCLCVYILHVLKTKLLSKIYVDCGHIFINPFVCPT